jgi:2,3-bisphosphoglycerate-dependent phosphoglycerate mutase
MTGSAEPEINLVLVRHGESATNAANVFTGWSNPPLTAIGRDEAALVAHRIRQAGLSPTRIFSSPADRASETVAIVQEILEGAAPVTCLPALNERDYGALTGRNKDEAAAEFGAAQVRHWRRSYAEAPPDGESLRDTAARVLAAYVNTILPAAMAGGTTLVVSHGNTLRALCMALDALDAAAVEGFDLSTGATIHYALSETTAIVRRAVLV